MLLHTADGENSEYEECRQAVYSLRHTGYPVIDDDDDDKLYLTMLTLSAKAGFHNGACKILIRIYK